MPLSQLETYDKPNNHAILIAGKQTWINTEIEEPQLDLINIDEFMNGVVDNQTFVDCSDDARIGWGIE